jgi:glycosyltransferase involved in cell wall biosynthesis
MKISTIIPTYNRRKQVFRAIQSVLAQTVPVDEIIVVDDGSTDGTSESVRSRFGSSVKIFTQKNGGVSAARNLGIREARGEWIAFLDSDDAWLPTKIERQVEALAAFGAEFGVCFTDNLHDGSPEMPPSRFQEVAFEGAPKFGTLEEPAKYTMAGVQPFQTSSLLTKRSLVEEIGGFDEAMAIGEDTDLFFRLSFRTKFCFVAEPLVRMDRAPSRPVPLSHYFSTRDDRKYDSLERRFAKWLEMPEVIGSKYEQPIREWLRLLYYSSIAAKIHDFRLGPAFRRMGRLRAMGDSYPSIISMLFSRKIQKTLGGAHGSARSTGWEL